MSEFTATHNWLVDGLTVEVICDGGEVYDRAHYWALREGRSGVAQYECDPRDVDAPANWVVLVGGVVSRSKLVAR